MAEPAQPKSLMNDRHNWLDKVSNLQQLGGIETSIIDNGRGRGVRSIWINTGSGLRFRILPDRGLDIVDAFFNQHSLAWLSHTGLANPDPSATEGTRWLDTFSGGLLTTCGLTHVGGPEEDEEGSRGLHDRISHIPAEVISIEQPNLLDGTTSLRVTGFVRQTTTFGPHLVLKRIISAELGSPVIKIEDQVVNHGNSSAPHMLLYHCNFGWPLVDEGTEIRWEGELHLPDDNSRTLFESRDYTLCPPPLDEHSGTGEAVGFIDIEADSSGVSRGGLFNPSLGIGVELSFKKKELPWLTNWQHFGKKEYVTALEPGTHPPIGRAAARANQTLHMLEPGEVRNYNLKFTIIGE